MKSVSFAAATFSMLLAVLAGAGCASAPLHYYTLMPSIADPQAPAGSPVPFAIEVLPVGLPEQLDQQRLVVRQGGSGLQVLEGERWAGPLSDELRAALSVQLARRLATQDLAGLSAPPGKPVLRIKVQVRRFDAWPGDHVRLEADWSLASADTPTERRTCHADLEESTPGTHVDMVLGQQKLISHLAERIESAARRSGTGC
jgi:uncharacterized lipoprotein YmbA